MEKHLDNYTRGVFPGYFPSILGNMKYKICRQGVFARALAFSLNPDHALSLYSGNDFESFVFSQSDDKIFDAGDDGIKRLLAFVDFGFGKLMINVRVFIFSYKIVTSIPFPNPFFDIFHDC